MTRAEIKEKAKGQIKGHIWMFFLLSVIVVALSFVSIIPWVGWIALLLFMPWISFNVVRIYWNFATKDENPEPSALFNDFGPMWGKAWILYVVMGIFTWLWSLLLFVPGIIKAISYSAAPYIMASNPEIAPTEAINQSKKLMHGHKMDYFVLQLSFLGWNLLAMLTLGILYIWLAPYMSTTQANFYADLGVGKAE